MVSKPFVFDVFVVKSAQAVTLSIIVLMCVTINDRTALKVTDVGLKLHRFYPLSSHSQLMLSWAVTMSFGTKVN